MLPSTILCIALLSLANCQYDYDEYAYDESGNDESGNDEVKTTTLPISTTVTEEDTNVRTKYAVFGGILGGLGVVAGLAIAGRQLCARSKEKKDDDDEVNKLDYDYYGIIHRRMSSSYV
jgi:hypothetical protein